MIEAVMRFRRLRLLTNPFVTLEPERFLAVLPEPPGLRQQLAGDWRTLELTGPPGSGKTIRMLFFLSLLRREGASWALARADASGHWHLEQPVPDKLEVLAADAGEARWRWLSARSLPREAALADRFLLAARGSWPARLLPAPVRTVRLERISPEEIAAYHRARVDNVSTGAPGRFPLTPEALHRLANLSESSYYRINRILYQAFEGLVRDEPLEEKAIERGYGGFLLEEQESAAARGRPPVLK